MNAFLAILAIMIVVVWVVYLFSEEGNLLVPGFVKNGILLYIFILVASLMMIFPTSERSDGSGNKKRGDD